MFMFKIIFINDHSLVYIGLEFNIWSSVDPVTNCLKSLS